MTGWGQGRFAVVVAVVGARSAKGEFLAGQSTCTGLCWHDFPRTGNSCVSPTVLP